MPLDTRPLSIVRDIAELKRTVSRLRQPTPKTHSYTKTGAISATSTGTMRLYNDTGRSLNITAVRASLATAPSTTSVIVDVKMGGTTLYTTTGNRPTLTTGSNTVAATLPDIITWTPGAYLTVDVMQADAAASDLTVQIVTV